MGNKERQSYVKGQIEDTLIDLLKTRELRCITVSDIIAAAEVSRNSFYRNYEDKEDVLRQHIARMLLDWSDQYESVARGSNAELYGSLFAYLKENSDFFTLLSERNLFHLFREAYLGQWGARTELSNAEAYVVAFVAGGTLGWIEEWLARGMQESAQTMTALLSAQGMA